MKKLESTRAYESAVNSHSVTVMDFMANWCAPCKMLSPILETIAEEYESKEEKRSGKKLIGFFKVDFDIMKTLASSLKITAIPVVLFLVNGVECARVIGFGKDTDKKLRKTIKACLKKAMKPSKKKPRKVKKTS